MELTGTLAPAGLQRRTGLLSVLSLPRLAGMAGCDPQRVAKLEDGVSTEVQVRQQFGDRVTITTLTDGSRIFDYPRQPEGWTNCVITIGPDGKVPGSAIGDDPRETARGGKQPPPASTPWKPS